MNLGTKNSLKELYDLEESGTSSSEGSGSDDEEHAITVDLARGDKNQSSSDEESDDEWDLEEVCEQ